jgi:hypothetical protein
MVTGMPGETGAAEGPASGRTRNVLIAVVALLVVAALVVAALIYLR